MQSPSRQQDGATHYVLADLFESTIKQHVGKAARVAGWSERPPITQGYSGANVRVYDVDVVDGCTLYDVPLVTKDVYLAERQAMLLLRSQAYSSIPFSWSYDYASNERVLLCQQFIDADGDPLQDDIVERAALELARMHLANMGNTNTLGWLPHADHAYFCGEALLQQWRSSWNEALNDDEFVAVYGRYTEAMEGAAAIFLRAMDELWDEADTLTLVHGDLHDGNILVQGGIPYFIDWEQAHYGTLYLDLPSYLSPNQSLLYHDALASMGYVVPLATFQQRYADMTRSLGFRYMKFWIDRWLRGGAARDRSRANIASLITTALTGMPTP
jgi:hypothetical protein